MVTILPISVILGDEVGVVSVRQIGLERCVGIRLDPLIHHDHEPESRVERSRKHGLDRESTTQKALNFLTGLEVCRLDLHVFFVPWFGWVVKLAEQVYRPL